MKTSNKLLLAQDLLLDGTSSSVCGGFNARVFGDSYSDAVSGAWDRAPRAIGWTAADELIQAGKIYFVHPFPHSDMKNCFAFPYGGTWVCNGCGNSRLEKPWWRVRVFKDGNAWCCAGEGFEDLQASENYAFGETRDAAMHAYAKAMTVGGRS